MNKSVQSPSRLASIYRLQDALLAREHLNVDELTTHYFSDGVYMRELLIPAGHTCVGKTHKFEHLNILLSGTIEVATESGSQRLTGPKIIKSDAGIKRAGYAVTDTVWITVHGNPDNEKDMDVLEARYIIPDLPVLEESLKIGDV